MVHRGVGEGSSDAADELRTKESGALTGGDMPRPESLIATVIAGLRCAPEQLPSA